MLVNGNISLPERSKIFSISQFKGVDKLYGLFKKYTEQTENILNIL